MPIQKRHNLDQVDRTVIVCRVIGWKPDTSRRIYGASREQAAAHNRAVEYLLDQPETPLRKSSKRGASGLQGLWLNWRTEGNGLGEILQAVWRPGVGLAKTRGQRTIIDLDQEGSKRIRFEPSGSEFANQAR